MALAGSGTADPEPLPQRTPGSTQHRPAATVLKPITPEQARAAVAVLNKLAADRDDAGRPTIGGMDAWGRPHAHDAF